MYRIKSKDKYSSKEWAWALKTLMQLLAPFAPHICEDIWQKLSQSDSIHISEWPTHDDKYLVEKTFKIVIQINGKLRGEIEVESDADEDLVIKVAKENKKVAGYLENQEIRKTVYITNKLVNFVV
jgi:leucyl-tRNA synthetase